MIKGVLEYTEKEIFQDREKHDEFYTTYFKLTGKQPCIGCPNGFELSKRKLKIAMENQIKKEAQEKENANKTFILRGNIQIRKGKHAGRYVNATLTDAKAVEILATHPTLANSFSKLPRDYKDQIADFANSETSNAGQSELTKAEIKEALDTLEIEYAAKATKAELLELYNNR